MTRRGFLAGAVGATAAAPYVLTSTALGAPGVPPAGERVTFALIGCGSRGGGVAGWLGGSGGQLVARCDPWASRRGSGGYRDFREVLARDDIDAVAIATPDHWHALIAIAAARAGKDMYCEKPLARTVAEGKACRRAIQTYSRVFQHGTQQRSFGHCRLGCELVRNGRIGRLREIHVGARYGANGAWRPPSPVPDDLDYDTWVGPAPWRPYTGLPRSNSWWFVHDYSLGYMTTCGAHPMDIAQWAFDTHLAGPWEIEGTGTIGTGEYDGLAKWKADIRFADGVRMVFQNSDQHGWGVHADYTRFIGTEGWIHVTYGALRTDPPSLATAELGPNDVRLVASRNHAANFIEAVKTRAKCVAHVDDAFRSDVICHLSDIAIRTGRKITWDPVEERIVGDPDASRWLARAMRQPWQL